MEGHVRAKALFDFKSSMPGELSFTANEILTITNEDVGDGWCEAKNSSSRSGLVPVSYIEIMRKAAAPVQPSVHMAAKTSTDNADAGWTDDEWDDDDEDVDEPVKSQGVPANNNNVPLRKSTSEYSVNSEKRLSTQGTIRQRFTRAGPELFVFDSAPIAVPAGENAIVILDGPSGPAWQNTGNGYTCSVDSPTIEKKFHGIKTYTAYQLVPSFSNIRVSRRYKQFDWLYQRLSDKFPTVSIPPLPDKQITGRFDDDFVTTRLKQLQMWIDRMCKHPIISQSDVFIHFLSCTDPKRWTAGKRKAEKDEFTGVRLFFTIQSSVKSIDSRTADASVESFSRFVKSMDDSVKNLSTVGERSAKKHEDAFSKHYRKIGSSFDQLAKSFELDERPATGKLTRAMLHTGKTYDEIGQLYAMQPKNDMCDLLSRLHEYHRLLSTFPDIIFLHKIALSRLMERENSGKLFDAEYENARKRVDVVAHSTLAEANHFSDHRVLDFNEYMRQYLLGQITFFKTITSKLEDNLQMYEMS